ncbi:hypothetical protein M011DRAFT_526817 [Sporormia fimetaria CBS 119925]|uniref:SRR1-like domain-containing protein n=1 Tax=Sporormia fimetaria CBS 119925 TaxID=1340428 RepID=A0A6A6VCA2_9PLEO|nr:hypothetical protein M011DRAFT_526817 [Sporormia fimetaria CBS 119925]
MATNHNLTGIYQFLPSWENSRPGPKTRGLWTMNMIICVGNLSKNLKHMAPGASYQVLGFDMRVHELVVPAYDPRRQRLDIRLVGPLDLSRNLDDRGQFISTKSYHVVPYYVQVVNGITIHQKERECDTRGSDKIWSKWKHEWRNGKWAKYSAHLDAIVKQHAKELGKVRNIVCLALGPLRTKTVFAPGYEKEHPRRFLQHLAAKHIRDQIEAYTGKKRSIPIIAQDPEYDDSCKRVLQRELGIQATEHFDGFKALTKDSLVICIAPSVDAVSMVCDLTSAHGGPRAILCDEIDMDTSFWHDANTNVAPWLRWHNWDGVTRSTKKEDGHLADRTSQLMAEYVGSCRQVSFGDFKDCVGIPQNEWRTTYHNLPTPAELKMELQELGGDKAKYKARRGKEFDQVFNFSKEKYAAEGKVIFGDLKFYVRKS